MRPHLDGNKICYAESSYVRSFRLTGDGPLSDHIMNALDLGAFLRGPVASAGRSLAKLATAELDRKYPYASCVPRLPPAVAQSGPKGTEFTTFHEVNGNVFVLADSVRPALSQFLKQRESTRNLLKRKRNDGTALIYISESAAAYGFMSKKKGRWSVAEHKNNAAKLFVSRDWINANLNANENAAEPAPILQAAGNLSELHGMERADTPLHDADSAARADSPLHNDEDLEDRGLRASGPPL
ncbi:hypothetical protein HDU86_008334 [Geranomyces michiganensis]|nr:hypothetical protein HDU86_008334 [Geranomyces michiganensis]